MTPNPEPDKDFPWWLVILVVIGVALFWQVLANPVYGAVLNTLARGITVTIVVAVVAYLGA